MVSYSWNLSGIFILVIAKDMMEDNKTRLKELPMVIENPFSKVDRENLPYK